MLHIPQSKLNDLVDEARSNAGILLPIDKLPNSIHDKKYRCGTVTKPKGINGWYLIKYDSGTEFITTCYGNWEDQSSYKYHINLKENTHLTKKLSPAERQALQAQINTKVEADRKKQEQEKQKKVAQYVAEYNQLGYCRNHLYAERKGINDLSLYNLRQDNRFNRNLLCIPFINSKGSIQGYQTIAPDGTKRFCGSVGGCFWQYPLTNPNSYVFDSTNSFFILGEGLSTTLMAKQVLEDVFDSQVFMAYSLVAFNCGNLDKVIKVTAHNKLAYFLLVDNDCTKPQNAGIEMAKQLIINNPNAVIYPIMFPGNQATDANDFILANGSNAFIDLLLKQTPIMKFIAS